MSTLPDPARLSPAILVLPRDARGFPIPWFVATLDDGSRDFRIACGHKRRLAFREQRCWICGGPLGKRAVFIGGPFSAINRVFGDWCSHEDCASAAFRLCPYLTGKLIRPYSREYPEGTQPPPCLIEERPEIACWYLCNPGKVELPPEELFLASPPRYIHWYRDGSRISQQEAQPVLARARAALGSIRGGRQ